MINRKKRCLLMSCAALLTVLAGDAQPLAKDEFLLRGKVINQDDGWVYLAYANKGGKRVMDSAVLNNGVFQFKGFIKEPTMAYFNGKLSSRSMDDPNSTSFFLEPAEMNITVKAGFFKDAAITGSKTEEEYQLLQHPMKKITDRWKVVMDTLSAVNKRSNLEYQELKSWVLRPYFAETNELQLSFIKSHPESYVTAYTLMFKGRDFTDDSLN